MRIELPRLVLQRARRIGAQVETELHSFIAAKANGLQPRRLDKPCGLDRHGKVSCQLHVDLRMGHYRLTANADPLLIYQQLDDLLWVVGITFHEDIFQGNEHRWCHQWQYGICWEENEQHLRALNDRFGSPP